MLLGTPRKKGPVGTLLIVEDQSQHYCCVAKALGTRHRQYSA